MSTRDPDAPWAFPPPRPRLEDYSKKYEDTFVLERRDGILQVQLQTDGGPGGRSGWFEVWSQAWWEIGNDPENDVIIITGTGIGGFTDRTRVPSK